MNEPNTAPPLPTSVEVYASKRIDVACMMGELKIKLDKNAHRMDVIRMELAIRMELDKHDAEHLAGSKNWAMNATTKPEPTAAKMTPQQVRERIAQLGVLVKDAEQHRENEKRHIQLFLCPHVFELTREYVLFYYVCALCGACKKLTPDQEKTKKEA